MLDRLFLTSTLIIGATLLLAGCQTSQSPRSEAHLSERWQGRSVQEFESRFGAPASTAGGNRLVYTATREEVTPAHRSGIGFGIAGVAVGDPMTSKVPATAERKSCTIELSTSNGTIDRIDIVKDDSTRQAASLCLLHFG